VTTLFHGEILCHKTTSNFEDEHADRNPFLVVRSKACNMTTEQLAVMESMIEEAVEADKKVAATDIEMADRKVVTAPKTFKFGSPTELNGVVPGPKTLETRLLEELVAMKKAAGREAAEDKAAKMENTKEMAAKGKAADADVEMSGGDGKVETAEKEAAEADVEICGGEGEAETTVAVDLEMRDSNVKAAEQALVVSKAPLLSNSKPDSKKLDNSDSDEADSKKDRGPGLQETREAEGDPRESSLHILSKT
jgi:hypothetical protein